MKKHGNLLTMHIDIGNSTNIRTLCSLREKVGGSEKEPVGLWCGYDWFKRVLRGYDEPAGCPWA